MTTLVFFLEEQSAKEMLNGILPKIFPNGYDASFLVFEGKQDLEKRLPIILRGWKRPNCRFLILRDQDSGDCKEVKKKLHGICEAARKTAIVRIACHELESFYLGDLNAVEIGLGLNRIAKKQQKEKYRAPDRLANPWQELTRLTKGAYQNVGGSRAIAPHMSLESNKSHSFRVLHRGIQKLIEANS
ncbi:MAG: DUF4276 family protein [Planctomycetes bacterium]|nr:DUF4276 family protein [Planctomycetota bacterium]